MAEDRGSSGRSRVSTALLIGAVILVGIQFVPVERKNPPESGNVGAPPEVESILQRACYDCHSNGTHWPWYSGVAPVSWLVARDVREGRRELNFSKWDDYKRKRKRKKLKEVKKEVRRREMPPWFYVLLHPDASLEKRDRRRLTVWAQETRDGLKKSKRRKSRSRRRR